MRHRIVIVLAAIALVAIGMDHAEASATLAGDLPRRAALGFTPDIDGEAVAVVRVQAGSPAETAGIKAGDRVVAINGAAVTNPLDGLDRLKRIMPAAVRLTVARGGQSVQIAFTAPTRPLEDMPGMDSFYDVADVAPGVRLRTIVATPQGASGRLPTLLFTQWVSCGSIEHNQQSPWRAALADFVRRNGMALARVERAPDGDSVGPACHRLDYDSEVAHYVAAYDRLLRSSPHLDRNRVYVLGSSLGSTTAPLVAKALQDRGVRVLGVAVTGGGAVTYFERMVNFERHYLERRPKDVQPTQIYGQMMNRLAFLNEYLIKARMPDDIARDSAAMAAVRGDILGLDRFAHYGRPFAYHQQAAKRDFLSAWVGLKGRALAVFGEFDQFEDRHGHALIAQMMNRLRPGSARFVELPRTDHDLAVHQTIEDAYAFAPGKDNNAAFFAAMEAWLRETR